MLRRYSIEDLLRQDRLILLCVLLFITVLSWLYIVYLYYNMVYMDMNALLFAMPMTPSWSVTDFVLLYLMWLVMMVGMMTPSVTPLAITFAKINRQRQQRINPLYVQLIYLQDTLLFGQVLV